MNDFTQEQSESEPKSMAWIAVWVLALSIFSVVCTEILPIGLLLPIAQDLKQSMGQTSLLVSLPAVVAAMAAPAVILLLSNCNRKTIMLFLMAMLFLSNVLSATANGFAMMLVSRLILGVAIGGIWSIAGGLAPRLVPPKSVALATSIVFGGVAAASVLGIPLGVYLGDLFQWRMAFAVMAVLVLVLGVLLWISLPSLPCQERVSAQVFQGLLRKKTVLLAIAICLLLVMGHFMAYTFVRVWLQEQAHFSDGAIGSLLLFYGVLGIIGNFWVGNTVQKRLKLVIFMVALGLSMALILANTLSNQTVVAIFALGLWGLAYGGVSVGLMTWMIRTAPTQIEPICAIYIATFNIAIGAGSFFGGHLMDALGLTMTFAIACALTLGAALLVLISPKMG